MSPKVLQADALIFWFHSYDARYENRASVHVGKGSQNDLADVKIWLEPQIEIAHPGRTLKTHELDRAINIIKEHHDFLMEAWYGYADRKNR